MKDPTWWPASTDGINRAGNRHGMGNNVRPGNGSNAGRWTVNATSIPRHEFYILLIYCSVAAKLRCGTGAKNMIVFPETDYRLLRFGVYDAEAMARCVERGLIKDGKITALGASFLGEPLEEPLRIAI